ncbi:unnamed protein product [Orchesella dallaii]|uniref:Uncharacterized protein n=1 Tax=Orchesella dallaii TaxID=48710 RepID=A0ABP1RQ70_9HEXA
MQNPNDGWHYDCHTLKELGFETCPNLQLAGDGSSKILQRTGCILYVKSPFDRYLLLEVATLLDAKWELEVGSVDHVRIWLLRQILSLAKVHVPAPTSLFDQVIRKQMEANVIVNAESAQGNFEVDLPLSENAMM